VVEGLQEIVYAGSWPGRVTDLVPASTRVTEVKHALDLRRSGRAALKLGFVSDLHIGRLGRKYPNGLYDLDGLRLYVSRGLGNVDLPLRLNAPPEVALFTIS